MKGGSKNIVNMWYVAQSAFSPGVVYACCCPPMPQSPNVQQVVAHA
jgi:hypothetical protein